jgi:hypothetical protein
MENTFKQGVEPQKQKAEVLISDKELAMYKYIGLKIAYQQSQAESVLQGIIDADMSKVIRLNNVVTRSFAALMIIAIVGLLIKNV